MKEINVKHIVDTISDNGVEILDFYIVKNDDNGVQIQICVPTETSLSQIKRISDALADDYGILEISDSLLHIDDTDVAECYLLWNI